MSATLTPVRWGSGDGAGLLELVDVVVREAPVVEGGVGVGAGRDGWALDCARGAAEAGRGGGLGRALHAGERVAGDVVRVLARLGHREDRREAHLVAREERDPLRARAAAEELGEARLQ